MKLVTVGVADLQVSGPPGVLVTYGLGSCIALMLHDPKRSVGGMLHFMLPQSSVAPEKAAAKPAMFADTGIPLLFESMYRRDCRKEDLVVKVCGGAAVYDDKGTFEIGKRNYVALKRILAEKGFTIAAEDVGGGSSRTARLYAATGQVTIRIGNGVSAL